MIAREYTGPGWGDPIDATKPEVWLANGYVCVYDPEAPGRVELWTVFGRTDSRYADTNSGRARMNAAICRAMPSHTPYFAAEYEAAGYDWHVHSRFD